MVGWQHLSFERGEALFAGFRWCLYARHKSISSRPSFIRECSRVAIIANMAALLYLVAALALVLAPSVSASCCSGMTMNAAGLALVENSGVSCDFVWGFRSPFRGPILVVVKKSATHIEVGSIFIEMNTNDNACRRVRGPRIQRRYGPPNVLLWYVLESTPF